MAFSPEQEKSLLQIIEAFENGKRLSDLPDVKGTNPYNLLVEVLDEDGESKKAALATLLPYLEEDCSYGVSIDTEVSSTTCPRLGNLALHKSLPIQNRMRGCLLDDNGKVVEYLDPKNWLGQVRDGSRGQVMVEIPMHYRKCETQGTKKIVRISEHPLPGYEQIPLMYVSAYEATIQRSTGKLCSVANMSVDFRGGNNNTEYDGTYRTLCGRPVASTNRTSFRNAARKRNPETTEWNAYLYEAHKALFWLFVIEYANLNSQAAFNAELTPEGFHQGGLGEGVTTIYAWWADFNGYNPFVPCGLTDSLGNGTGTVSYTAANDDSTIIKTFDVPRYRGIENPFGHIRKWVDGINVRISADIDKGGDGLSKVFTCNDPALFSDSGYDGYSHVGNEARENGYVKSVIFGIGGEIVPDVIGGGSTQFFCDYHYTNAPSSGEALRGMIFGGTASSGAIAGLACASSLQFPLGGSPSIGSRLCFKPAKA